MTEVDLARVWTEEIEIRQKAQVGVEALEGRSFQGKIEVGPEGKVRLRAEGGEARLMCPKATQLKKEEEGDPSSSHLGIEMEKEDSLKTEKEIEVS